MSATEATNTTQTNEVNVTKTTRTFPGVDIESLLPGGVALVA